MVSILISGVYGLAFDLDLLRVGASKGVPLEVAQQQQQSLVDKANHHNLVKKQWCGSSPHYQVFGMRLSCFVDMKKVW